MGHEVELLCHAVGLSDNWTGPWRNHFCASPHSPDDRCWQELTAKGDAMLLAGPSQTYPFNTYSVTKQGLDRVYAHVELSATAMEMAKLRKK